MGKGAPIGFWFYLISADGLNDSGDCSKCGRTPVRQARGRGTLSRLLVIWCHTPGVGVTSDLPAASSGMSPAISRVFSSNVPSWTQRSVQRLILEIESISVVVHGMSSSPPCIAVPPPPPTCLMVVLQVGTSSSETLWYRDLIVHCHLGPAPIPSTALSTSSWPKSTSTLYLIYLIYTSKTPSAFNCPSRPPQIPLDASPPLHPTQFHLRLPQVVRPRERVSFPLCRPSLSTWTNLVYQTHYLSQYLHLKVSQCCTIFPLLSLPPQPHPLQVDLPWQYNHATIDGNYRVITRFSPC